MKKKKIAYLTGTRADFGIVSPFLQTLEKDPHFQLQVYATGMHLMPQYGRSIDLVRSQFPNVKIIRAVFKKNSPAASGKFGGQLLTALTTHFSALKPDLLFLHGDRIEMLIAAIAATYLGIPIAHHHGGDLSSTVDDTARHAITKLAQLHFAATIQARKVLLHLGEDEKRIHVVGTLALDTILHQQLKTKTEILKFLDLSEKNFLLLSLHPISEDITHSGQQMRIVIRAALSFGLPLVIIYPNADPGSTAMIQEIEKVRENPLVRIFQNIEYATYLSIEKHASVWIGNSSAGIVDSPSFKTPVVNVGTRQTGRVRSANIIDVDYNSVQIQAAIKKALTDKFFLKKVQSVVSPWGRGNAGKNIIHILKRTDLHEKSFIQKNQSR